MLSLPHLGGNFGGLGLHPQYDLFTLFVTNEPNSISNTVELWESIPKYFFTPKQEEKLRTVDGLAKPYKWEYSHNGLPCTVKPVEFV
jgi:hypothetical protein